VDRRTDVYALGAILYFLLTGRPPFDAKSPVALLAQIIAQEPRHPNTLDPNIPNDLGIIALACLQKVQRNRLDSAQALADELGRWLEGRSITTRPPGRVARLARLVRRRPLPSAAIIIAAVAIAVASAVGFTARWQAREQMRLARDLGAQEERLAARIRHVHMLPLHDITAEIQGVRDEMAVIEARIQELGAVAEGPGHAAFGRTHLALGDFQEARRHLELARQNEFDRTEVRSALGQTLTWLYRRALTEAAQERDEELRLLSIQKARKELRDPALELLVGSPSGSESERNLILATVALLEDRYEDALRFARDSIAAEPWRHEAKVLAGDALLDRTLYGERKDHDATVAGLQQAASAYREAIAIAP
jgi:serine/threonine-protein kinase